MAPSNSQYFTLKCKEVQDRLTISSCQRISFIKQHSLLKKENLITFNRKLKTKNSSRKVNQSTDLLTLAMAASKADLCSKRYKDSTMALKELAFSKHVLSNRAHLHVVGMLPFMSLT